MIVLGIAGFQATLKQKNSGSRKITPKRIETD